MAGSLLDPVDEVGLDLVAKTLVGLQPTPLLLWDQVVARIDEVRDNGRLLITVSPTPKMLARGERLEVDLGAIDAFGGDTLLSVGGLLPYKLYVVQQTPLRVADRRLWCRPVNPPSGLKLLFLVQVDGTAALAHIGVRTSLRALPLSVVDWDARGFEELHQGKSIWCGTLAAEDLDDSATSEEVDAWLTRKVTTAADLLSLLVPGMLARDLRREALERDDLERLRSAP